MPPELIRDDLEYNPETGEFNVLSAPGEEQFRGDLSDAQQPEPEEFVKGLLGFGADLATVGAGMTPYGLPLRTALTGLTGAAAGAINPNEDISRGVSEAGMEAGFGILSNKIPRAGLRLALMLGGIKGPLKRHRGEATDAFMRIRERYNPLNVLREEGPSGVAARVPEGRIRGLSIGQDERTETARLAVGKKMEDLETQIPGEVYIPGVFGSTDEIFDKAKHSRRPIDRRVQLNDDELEFIRQHINARSGQPWMNFRDANETARNLRNESRSLLDARANRQYVPPDELAGAQSDDAIARRLEEIARHDAEIQGGGDLLKALDALKSEFKDLKMIERVNASITSNLGQAGVRGGLGHGAVGNVEFLAGHPTGGTAPALAGILASLGGDPKNLSKLGFALGHTARATPTLDRLDTLKDNESRRVKDRKRAAVRRRQPK
jgi:hypothetical protein